MAKRYSMTWKPETGRWRKMHRGKWYSVSCKQLGVPETKEASWRAANAWWETQQALADIPPEDDRLDTRHPHQPPGAGFRQAGRRRPPRSG